MRALAAAAAAVRTHWRLVLVTFFIQFAIAGLASFTVWLVTIALSDGSALSAEAADGDLSALIMILKDTPALMIAPCFIGLTAVLAYAAVSWFMVGGLIGVFRENETEASVARFGKWGMARFFGMARLALYSLIPYIIVIVVFFMCAASIGKGFTEHLSMDELFFAIALGLLPVFVLLWLVWTVIDVARVHLVALEKPQAWRAIGRAFKTAVRSPSLFAITLAGHILSGIFVLASLKLFGVGGGIGAFVARQLFFAARHAVHIGVIGAEVDRVDV